MIAKKNAKPARFHKLKRFGRRLKASLNYPIMLPRGIWWIALFFSSYGIAAIVQSIIRGDYV